MRALELTGFDGPSSLHLVDRPEPVPGPGEVRVRFRAMALNHLDVFITRGLPKRDLPAVLGADGAGVVEAVGQGVDRPRLGDEVLLYPLLSCGHAVAATLPRSARDGCHEVPAVSGQCPACQAGQRVHCPRMAILGEHADGTFQEALVIPAHLCYPRPTHVSWEEAAALPLAALTAWRLLFSRGQLLTGESLLVVGIGGGVATACLLLAKAHGLRVFVTSRDPEKRERALALGADAAFPSESYGKAVQEATGGQGVRAVVDSVGPATLDESLRALAREGVLLLVGATSGPKAELLLPRLWFRHLSIVSSTMGNPDEFENMLHDVNEHQLRPPVDSVFPLEQGPAAFARMEAGRQFGKLVLVP